MKHQPKSLYAIALQRTFWAIKTGRIASLMPNQNIYDGEPISPMPHQDLCKLYKKDALDFLKTLKQVAYRMATCGQ